MSTADSALRAQLRALIDLWDSEHADWCCTKGCPHPLGQHLTDDAINDFTESMSRGKASAVPLATVPCPGICSCEVGRYIAALRYILIHQEAS